MKSIFGKTSKVSLFLGILVLCLSSCEKNNSSAIERIGVEIQTGEAYDILFNQARLPGILIITPDDKQEFVNYRYSMVFYYGLSDNVDDLIKEGNYIRGYCTSAQTQIVSGDDLTWTSDNGIEKIEELYFHSSNWSDKEKLKPDTQYYFVPRVLVFNNTEEKEYYGSVKSFRTPKVPDGAVDLGLSVPWAECNLGASTPEKSGGYYSWGEVKTKDSYGYTDYRWKRDDYTWNYEDSTDFKYNRYHDVLDLEDDAAYVNLGRQWRMPTLQEWGELKDECSWKNVNSGDAAGWRVESTNGNSIFLPAAGEYIGFGSLSSTIPDEGAYYWSSSLYPYWSSSISYYPSLGFCDQTYYHTSLNDGCSIRPVANPEFCR